MLGNGGGVTRGPDLGIHNSLEWRSDSPGGMPDGLSTLEGCQKRG